MAKPKYEEWLTEEGLLKIEGWARDGLTDEQIAHNMGISRATLNNWKVKHVDILDTLKRGKEVIDRQVENALLKRAFGYDYTERQVKIVNRDKDVVDVERRKFQNKFKLDNPEATQQEIIDASIEAIPTTERIVLFENDKHMPPDTTATIFWLKNRMPKEWRDKRDVSLEGKDGEDLNINIKL
ncbi:hypothetical protein BG262_02795 [Floricoccus penangensis]|uniref:Helix-turn-helix domain-containing protein n=1 Tax=Floricoccus penangensis TaxID=1859475 RepID=A0A9Q5JGK5_9LACT|nr:hypothetical protein [Floricoccus penangensis]OFI46743.1 hypothetical protein BG262_02795 [Floricoccus penangensis]